jgi:hypothetical protein
LLSFYTCKLAYLGQCGGEDGFCGLLYLKQQSRCSKNLSPALVAIQPLQRQSGLRA